MAEFKQLAEAQGLLNALKLRTMVNLNPFTAVSAYRQFSYPTRLKNQSLKLSTK